MIMMSIPAFGGTEKDAPVIGDILFARPLGIAGVLAGAGLYVLSLPFAAVTGSLGLTTETLITKPVKFTFARPVGDFDYSLDHGKQETDK
jgi:hypothetical protein